MDFKKIAGILAAASFLMPVAAFASVDNVLFNNGTTGSVTAQAGSTIGMDILISSTGTDVDSVWVNFPGAGGAAQVGRCYDITPNQIGSSPAGGWTVHVDLDRTPMNANLWDMTVSTYGLDAVDAEDNTCSTGVDFTHTFNGNDRRVTITANSSTGSGSNNSGGTGSSSGNTGGGSGNAALDALTAAVAALTAQVNAILHPATPPSTGGSSAACTAYAQANAGTQPNTYNDANVRLQGFLLSQGASIPALKAGASFGFYGNQTTAAVGWFNSLNHCS